ncbi:radical SAM protein [Thermoanaerobacterium sp. RBIITD]|uniref:radical SAM protein n=1 Tax=Thermoanaerobacterium sp. RBIITD TaxID=1550240 RepID=UPI000BB8ADB3|nr:radical SAM protein [Thermoanaerobacterium sp. RBIITD]
MWIEFFKNNKFIIGISLDGPKFIHDKHRLNRKGYSSFEDTINGILLLKQCNISINIISVINNDYVNYGGQILEYFVDLGINVVDFIPCYFYNDRYTLSVENYKNFMINIFDIWMKKYKNVIKIRFLNDIFQNILRKYDKNIRVNVGCELGEVCGRNYSISVNGDIFPCECLTPIDYMKLGNIKEEDFISILKKREFNEFKELYNNVSKDCLRCDILDICHAGCLNRRLPQYTYNLKDYYCEARKGIIYHILNNLDLYFPKRKI